MTSGHQDLSLHIDQQIILTQQYHVFWSAHLDRVAFEAGARECGLVFGAQRANGRVVLGHRTLLRVWECVE